MARRIKLILNPIANTGQAWRVVNDLRPIVAERGGADWSGTVYPGHAAELAKQAALDGYDLVIVLGGDGTIHEVINGLMQAPVEKRPALGIVPTGSGNDFAYALGIPTDARRAILQALDGAVSAVDLGLLVDENGRREYFGNTLGIGFDTIVNLYLHQFPLLRGVLMYLVAVIQTILLNHNPARMQMEIDGEKMEQENLMVVICNGPREGSSFMIAPNAKADDGLLNYAMVRKVSRAMMFRLLPEVMKGTHGKFPQVKMGTCKKFLLTSDRPLYIHTDGEVISGFGSNLKRIAVEILPGALRIAR
ncbi:MAG: diacylglycerol kinase family protein [Anaerolineales bacterium]